VPEEKEVKYSKKGIPILKTAGAADEESED
jgi:hypothetical protein